jgi:hypothetical protein
MAQHLEFQRVLQFVNGASEANWQWNGLFLWGNCCSLYVCEINFAKNSIGTQVTDEVLYKGNLIKSLIGLRSYKINSSAH